MIVKLLVLVVLLFGYSESKTDENPASLKWREFRNVVTLHRLSKKNEILPFCSGYVIDEKLVLTAAHCVADSNGKLNITGVYVLYRGKNIGNMVTQRVSTGVMLWRDKQNLHDLALLSIIGSFPEHMNQMKWAQNDRLLEGGRSECQAIAWDIRQSKDSKEYFKIYEQTDEGVVIRGEYNCNGRCNQKKIPMTTVDIYDCNDTLSKNNYIMSKFGNQFCASTHNLENCERLSGAPVICSGVLHGIFSYGKICNKATPSVITRVSHLKKWITSAILYLRQRAKPRTKVMREFAIASVKNVPQVVALFRFANGDYRPFCGGGIINKKTVLTAAHCLIDSTGNINIDGIFIMSSYEEFRFNEVDEDSGVAIHPGFNWENRSNDIALVRINGEFHPDISPVILALDDDVTSDLKRFSDCRILGWGFRYYKSIANNFKQNYNSSTPWFSMSMDKSDCSRRCVLQEASVRPLPLSRCRRSFNSTGIELETNGSQFCTFGGIYHTCRGDSGDMVFCEGKAYGIISNGLICGNTHRPIINMRIGYYRKWIIEAMNKLEKGK